MRQVCQCYAWCGTHSGSVLPLGLGVFVLFSEHRVTSQPFENDRLALFCPAVFADKRPSDVQKNFSTAADFVLNWFTPQTAQDRNVLKCQAASEVRVRPMGTRGRQIVSELFTVR